MFLLLWRHIKFKNNVVLQVFSVPPTDRSLVVPDKLHQI